MSVHMHGSCCVKCLIGNIVQINFGVIWNFVLYFSYLWDNRECWNWTDYIVRSCWRLTFLSILRKSVHLFLIATRTRPKRSRPIAQICRQREHCRRTTGVIC